MTKSKPCGCPCNKLNPIKHWLKYTRLRLAARHARGWMLFWKVDFHTRIREKFCGFLAWMVPFYFELGMMSMDEAVSLERRWSETSKSWRMLRNNILDGGCDQEHRSGRHGGHNLVMMTKDEFDHWYKRR